MADATRRSARFSMRSKQLGQLLLENGDIKAEDIAQALATQEEQGGLIGGILRAQNSCDELAIAQALLKQVQVTDIRCEEVMVDPELGALIPRETCETEKLCPFERLGNLLCVAMGNPLNRRAITQIEDRTHLKVKSFKSTWPKIQDLISRLYDEEAPPEASEQEEAAEAPGQEEAAEAPGQEEAAEAPAPAADGEDVPPSEAEVAVEEAAPAFSPRERAGPGGSSAARIAAWRKEEPAEPVVEGIDNLDESHAEMIETTSRGLARTSRKAPAKAVQAPRPRPVKKAKVNIDLDTLDLSNGEIVKTAGEHEENMEELYSSLALNKPLARHAGKIVGLKMVRDGYFYTDGKAPGERTDELLALLESLPLAEVVSQSIGEYEAEKSSPALAAVPDTSPADALELRQAPLMPVAALLLSEDDFQKAVNKLVEDPIGEWEWQVVAPGPLAVVEYEEN